MTAVLHAALAGSAPADVSAPVHRLGGRAAPLARRLRAAGARIAYHDPHVGEWTVDGQQVECAPDLGEALAGVDLVILLPAHSCYDLREIATEAPVLLDTQGVTTAGEAL